MIQTDIKLLDSGYPNRQYIVSGDFAYGESVWADHTVFIVIDYTDEPWKVVGFVRMKAKDVPVPVQYEMFKDLVSRFRAKAIIDSSGPGGKNAYAFLKDIHPIPFEAGITGGNTTRKYEGLASLKAAMDGAGNTELSRVIDIKQDGTRVDRKKNWGIIKIPNIPELISELINYRLDDKKLKTDSTMSLMMAVDWLMMRRPKQVRNRAVAIDMLADLVNDRNYEPAYFPYSRKKKAYEY